MVVHKKVIKNQKYEKYWQLTLAVSDFWGDNFIRPLRLIIEHIDKYDLANKTKEELMHGNFFNQEVSHAKDLQEKFAKTFKKYNKDGASNRKLINTYIKLGFIKPYLQGYAKEAKEYIKPNNSEEKLRSLFSDIVYQNASFNSSQTKDDTDTNQVKFIIKTLLNRKSKRLTNIELMGLMNIDITPKKNLATEKDIQQNLAWAQSINFKDRKYNQIRYTTDLIGNKMNLFKSVTKDGIKYIALADNAQDYLPKENKEKTRDTYRFSNMKKAVFEESIKVYGKKICWLTKRNTTGLVVSHLVPSAEAIGNYDYDTAYDPNNALLLAPGDPDQFIDKHKITINPCTGAIIYGSSVKANNDYFIKEASENNYKIDSALLTSERKQYIKLHNKRFKELNK